MFDFDNSTGSLSNGIILPVKNSRSNEFSNSGRYLYILGVDTAPAPALGGIFQFDLINPVSALRWLNGAQAVSVRTKRKASLPLPDSKLPCSVS